MTGTWPKRRLYCCPICWLSCLPQNHQYLKIFRRLSVYLEVCTHFGNPLCLSTKESPYNAEMQEAWVQSLGSEGPLKEKMTTHSRILVWKTPWTEKSGGLQPTGLPRVGQGWRSEHANMSTLWGVPEAHSAQRRPTGLLSPLMSSQLRHEEWDSVHLGELGCAALTKSKILAA